MQAIALLVFELSSLLYSCFNLIDVPKWQIFIETWPNLRRGSQIFSEFRHDAVDCYKPA